MGQEPQTKYKGASPPDSINRAVSQQWAQTNGQNTRSHVEKNLDAKEVITKTYKESKKGRVEAGKKENKVKTRL